MAVWCVKSDPCGMICAWMTTGLLVFAYYVQIFQILAPWYGLWSIYTIIYAATTVLALAAHFRAQFTDPGAVPKPAAKSIDEIPMKQAVNAVNAEPAAIEPPSTVGLPSVDDNGHPILWKYNECKKCRAVKPLSAHHCSTCKRCIIHLDHHCPWINNCVGMMNQKYFILFLWHTFWLCIFSGVSLVSRFISCTSKPGFPRIYAPGCDWDTLSTVMAIMNFIEALLFGLFTGIMMFDQFGAIFENTTYIDSLKGQRGVQRGKMESLVSVFGERFSWRWFVPFASTTQLRKEFGQLCSDLLKPIRAPPPPAPAVPPVADSPQTGGAVNRHPTAPSGTA